MSAETPYVLGYWKIRGIAAPIRMAFAYAGKPLKQEVYGTKEFPAGQWGASDYGKMAEAHPFPNLPYLKTPSGLTLVQSNAIIRHVGRAFGLFGDSSNEDEVARIDELLEQINDLRVEAVNNYYGGVSEDFKTKTIPYYLDCLEKHMTMPLHGKPAAGGPYFFGAKVTIVDFMVYEIVRTCLSVEPEKKAEYFAKYPKVAAFLGAVEAIPQLESYYKSEYYTYGANAPVATCCASEPFDA